MLALVLDENERREHPLRFVITLLNHQPGYGAPNPKASLDDQDPKSPWHAKRLYLESSFAEAGQGLIAERIKAFAAQPAIARSPHVLAWELVNELDTFRSIAAGTFQGPEAAALRERFLVPALSLLAQRFEAPLLLGELRGHAQAYPAFARSVIDALPEAARLSLVWTSHVYAPRARDAAAREIAQATEKLDRDVQIAASRGLPLLLGEIGQTVPGSAPRFCKGGAEHDLEQLFSAVFDPKPPASSRPRRDLDAALFWGEGLCDLPVAWGEGMMRAHVSIGAGGDSADLGPDEARARAALRAVRAQARFLTE